MNDIKILLASDDQELFSAFRAVMGEMPDFELVGVGRNSNEALGLVATEHDLDIVLIDENIGPTPAHDLVREISMRRPNCAAVLLSTSVDENVLTRALEAGARGVLSRQPSLEELQTRLSTAAEWARGISRWIGGGQAETVGGRRGRIVVVAGSKGGTGTTTLAVQLALTAAAKKNRSVCLVDMDLQSGDVPSYLDMVHRRTIADLVEVAGEITGSMLADTLFVHPDGPHVLLAPVEAEQAEDVTALAARQILGALRSRYDTVIVDCGTFMTEGTVTAVELADKVALTVTPDLPSLRSAKRMVRLWARLEARKGEEVVAVLTRQTRKNEIQPDFAARILGLPLAKTTIPPAFRALEKAINNASLSKVEDDAFRKAVLQLAGELGIVDGEPADGGGKRIKAGAR
ncbi:AAA family ATPase [Actinomadura kijaniata]|uniref:Pilus assembly protein CpaE n=1 Tax=Actinomadura namibiensis TaxID=182080 RepID=A0A7W3LI80_ACTNM|nr:AAA family ATPase [Actinomadura namibiensis]MBA8948545.1 pilus assembly protein CpaE [Actinomadura namibiensis]